MPYSIEVKNLGKYYYVPKGRFLIFPKWEKVKVIKNISFKIREGEFVGLLGPNGSGKTTTIKILSGILVPEEGEVKVLDHVPWKKEKDFLKSIAVMYGNRTNLMFDVPVIDSLLLFKEIYEIDDKVFKERLDYLSSLLEIKELLETPVRKLSFGQRMRAELLSIFLHKPKVVLLDEPTIGLDVVAAKKVRDFLKKINREEKTTIILTTHNMRDVEKLCKRTLLIKEGEIIFDGKTKDLVKKLIKYKDVVLEFEEVLKDDKEFLTKFGLKKENGFVKGRIPYSKQVEFIKNAFEVYRIKTLTIEDQSLEELIEEVFEH